jgi:hypothetical protein
MPQNVADDMDTLRLARDVRGRAGIGADLHVAIGQRCARPQRRQQLLPASDSRRPSGSQRGSSIHAACSADSAQSLFCSTSWRNSCSGSEAPFGCESRCGPHLLSRIPSNRKNMPCGRCGLPSCSSRMPTATSIARKGGFNVCTGGTSDTEVAQMASKREQCTRSAGL